MDKELDMRLSRIEEQLAQLVGIISNVHQEASDTQTTLLAVQAALAEVQDKLQIIDAKLSNDINRGAVVAYQTASDLAALKLAR